MKLNKDKTMLVCEKKCGGLVKYPEKVA